MATTDASKSLFEEIDTNRDGKIDRREFRQWLGGADIRPATSYETLNTGFYYNDNASGRWDRNKYSVDTYTGYGSTGFGTGYGTGYGAAYGGAYGAGYSSSGLSTSFINETAIHTNSLDETNDYIDHAVNVYRDPSPQVVRRAAIEGPITYEQRIHVRYLEPPEVPPPGPLIVKEVRRQQSPAPPLVIREHAPPPASPPPLILRERPPTPPAPIPSETVTKYLPDIPAPPRSVIIERLPAPPAKPRDIIIERWIPYGPPPPRRTIVESAASEVKYPDPRNTIVIYEAVESRVVRKFQNLGITRESPSEYVARYGGTLLDSATIVREARNAGVHEDITVPLPSSSTYASIRDSSANYLRSGENVSYLRSSGSTNYLGSIDNVTYVRPGEIRSGDSLAYVRSGDIRSGDNVTYVRSGDIRSGDNVTYVRSGDIRTTEIRSGDIRASDIRSGDILTSETVTYARTSDSTS